MSSPSAGWFRSRGLITIPPPSDVQNVAPVKLRVNCQFTRKSGAALVIYKPQISCLPRNEQLTKLLKESHAVLKGKCIVTEVISCPAYIMVMSSQRESCGVGPSTTWWLISGIEGEHFSASLDANILAPSGTVGGSAKAGWTADIVHGLWRSGHDTSPIYRPLYKLKQPLPSFWEGIFGRRSESDSIGK